MAKRIVIWGTGFVGKMVIPEVLRHPDFELVGVGVSNPAKVGVDVGEICGLPGPTGVLATDDVDVVQGWKIGRGDSWYRKVIGRCYHHTVKLLFRLPVRDTDCDFRLFRRSLLTERPLTSTTGVICVEMMRNFSVQGARFVETPVHHYFRPYGRSQFFRLPAIARSALALLRLWYRMVVRDAR